jgi:hypothetical protein
MIQNSSTPKILLHVEGLALFIAAIVIYAYTQGNGWAFLLLVLTPDLAMIGYKVNTRIGSFSYNAVHTSALPLALLVIAWVTGGMTVVHLALIWLAHIGIDRALGYGLKYPTEFKDTHLQRV